MATVHIHGVPLDEGGGRGGASGGPESLRSCGLLDLIPHADDRGDITPAMPHHAHEHPEDIHAILAATAAIKERTYQSVKENSIPLVLGGDHSIAAGSMAGVAQAFRELGRPVPALLWFDAHVDLNTLDTSPSGNLHGMPAAALLGYGVPGLDEVIGEHGMYDANRCAFIGHRDVDPGEVDRMNTAGFPEASANDFHEGHPEDIIDDILAKIAPNGAPFCLSFDIDVADPSDAPGVDTPVPHGLDSEVLRRSMKRIAAHGGLVAMDLVEVNPVFDDSGRTAQLAAELAAIAFPNAH